MRIGPYEVLGELGRGGMGVVYRVRAPGGGEAALKLLGKTDAGAFARFEREGRLLASLGAEDGFVPLLDAGATAEGAWLVMPLVPGGTLRQRLEAGPLGVEEAVDVGMQLARALGAAHARGIVHRDVKPENVLFAAPGRVLLADLGLGKHFDRGALGASQSLSLTGTGVFKGTAGYMAPEQVEDAARAGPPADVFALGAVLYECLSGHPAFQGENLVEVVARVGSGVVEPLDRRDLPPWLESVIRRALALDPAERFADGTRLAHALSERGAGSKLPRSRRGLLLPLALGVLAGGVLLGAVVLGAGSPRQGAPEESRVARPGPPRAPAPAPPPAAPAPPPAAHVPWPEVRELVDRAKRKIDLEDYTGALADTTRAIELDPAYAMAYVVRGGARLDSGDVAGSIVDEEKALELDDTLALAWTYRALARQKQGDADGAIADASKAIELEPKAAVALEARFMARLEKGDRKGAIEDATRAIELDPRRARVWGNRGAVREDLGQHAEAESDYTKAIELDPRQAMWFANRGRVRHQKGDLDGAIDDLARAVELDPNASDAAVTRAQLAEARRMRGR